MFRFPFLRLPLVKVLSVAILLGIELAAGLWAARGLLAARASYDPAPAAAPALAPDIEQALVLLGDTGSGAPLAKLVREFHDYGGVVVFEPLPTQGNELAFGDFSGFSIDDGDHVTGKIRINSQLRGAPEVVATIIAGEIAHLQDALAGEDNPSEANGCFAGEARAFVTMMRTWGELHAAAPTGAEPSSIIPIAYSALEYRYSLFSDLAARTTGQDALLTRVSSMLAYDYAPQCLPSSADAQTEDAYQMVVKDKLEKSYRVADAAPDPFATPAGTVHAWGRIAADRQSNLLVTIQHLADETSLEGILNLAASVPRRD